MTPRDEAFLARLLATFRVEAAERIAAVATALVELEGSPSPQQRAGLVEGIFREVHSLKGAARTANLGAVEAICQAAEEIFAVLKRTGSGLPAGGFDLLHRSLDVVSGVIGAGDLAAAGGDRTAVHGLVGELAEAARQLEAVAAEARPAEISRTAAECPPPEGVVGVGGDSLRVSKAKLDSVLVQAENLVYARQSLRERAAQAREIVAALSQAEGRDRKRPATDREPLQLLAGRVALLEKGLRADQRAVGSLIDGLLGEIKGISMAPFSSLFEFLPRTVRDLAHAEGKEAVLTVSGGELEVDRRILEEIKDPLRHLVRNAIDHGLETPEERIGAGKSRAGKISVTATHREGQKVELAVADDGRGIEEAEVRAAAVRLGLLPAEEAAALDPGRALGLIFRSGVSTSGFVTDISGRGLGLAIVQEKAERLGGAASCESSPEGGTVFRLLLPLTLASVRGLLVRLDERVFVLPAADVRTTLRVRPEEVRSVGNRPTLAVAGATVPLVLLRDLLEMPARPRNREVRFLPIVLLEADGVTIAVEVDEVLHEQEVLVKGLGRQLRRVRNLSGVCLLGSGRLVPVLNVSDLVKSALKAGEGRMAVSRPAASPAEAPAILVVEDSITARTLLRNILEAAGYRVWTAVDGVDAYNRLKAEKFDLVVSDVEMPRLNGFELTEKIRADKQLEELPVVLVTALESRADRERGIEVGANAYIVKSSFDQSNLLDVLRRLT